MNMLWIENRGHFGMGEKLLKFIDSEHKHEEIFRFMAFPDTKKIRKEPKLAITQCEYKNIHVTLVHMYPPLTD
jgi:hypothetical protein